MEYHSDKYSVLALNVGANLVGKAVELSWVQLVVSTGIFFSGTSESLNLGFGWVDVVGLKVSLNSDGEFFFGDLTVSVGVNLLEYLVRLFHADTWFIFGGDSDGSGGGDEGEEGEFHFSFVLFFNYI